MSSPIKPWEGAGVNSRGATPIRSSLNPRPTTPYGDRPNNLIPSPATTMNDAGQNSTRNPPPVPNRPQRSTYGTASGYNGGMLGSYGKLNNKLWT